jgi:hypothetical protein
MNPSEHNEARAARNQSHMEAGLRRLILLPERPGASSGYQKAVAADVERLVLTPQDRVICYGTGGEIPSEWKLIQRPKLASWQRALNVVNGRASTEVSHREIAPLIHGTFDEIFCGDVIFYRAARTLFPHALLHVRFHNFFTLLLARNGLRRYTLPPPARLTMELLSRAEKAILRDRNVAPIFISPEEHRFFELLYPDRHASVWPVTSLPTPLSVQVVPKRSPRLVWFGGLSAHKRFGLDYFLNRVFSPLRSSNPNLEFHLFGKGTERYHGSGVFGHGKYAGQDFPYAHDSLYVNPDLLGGGVKLKVADWITRGIAFISTPFGVEGYELSGDVRGLVAEIDDWPTIISEYLAGGHHA